MAISRAIEHETLACAAAPVLFGAFQREAFYRQVEPRYRRMARQRRPAAVFADFDAVRRPPGGPAEIPIDREDALGNEWAVIVDAPGYAACLLAWEQPGADRAGDPDDVTRRFEAIWTVDPRRDPPRRPGGGEARRPGRRGPRPRASRSRSATARWRWRSRSPALTALTNRVIAYMEQAG